MFNLRFQISLPFDQFRNLGCLHGRLWGNWAWELEHTWYSGSLVDLDVKLTGQQDHAGFEITVGVLGYGIHFHIYDTRHYDKFLNKWMEEHHD
jgi:hypothetical protein